MPTVLCPVLSLPGRGVGTKSVTPIHPRRRRGALLLCRSMQPNDGGWRGIVQPVATNAFTIYGTRRSVMVGRGRAFPVSRPPASASQPWRPRTDSEEIVFDLKITGGTVVDGTGAGRYHADIGIKDGKIVDVVRRGPNDPALAASKQLSRRNHRRDRTFGRPRLRRHPHPLRRPGELGRPARAVQRPRRHHSGDR